VRGMPAHRPFCHSATPSAIPERHVDNGESVTRLNLWTRRNAAVRASRTKRCHICFALQRV
jgi:hypothetical protein